MARPAASPPGEAQSDDEQSPAVTGAKPSQGAIPVTADIPVPDKPTANIAPTPQATVLAGQPVVAKDAGLSVSSPVAPSGTTADVVDKSAASPLPPSPAAQATPPPEPAKPEPATDLKTALKTEEPAVNGQATGTWGQIQRNESSPMARPAASLPVEAQSDDEQSPATNRANPGQSAIPLTAKNSLSDNLTREAPPTPQPVARAGEPAVPKVVESSVSPPVAPSGTPVATNEVRMKSAVNENEFAGSALQDLPSDGQIAPSAGGAGNADKGAKASQPIIIDFPADQETPARWMAVGITHAGAANPTMTANAGSAGTPAAPALSQVERMISREVTMVRQSGAESLAVTLKVDSRTSLFLQLTNHNGQIEASVRCEKGGAGVLDSHWGELQESLARQNVQLLPLQDNSRDPSNLPPATAWNFNDPQPRQKQPQPQSSAEAETLSQQAMKAAAGPAKANPQPQPRHGWEKWA